MSMLISPGRVKENLLADFMRNISWKIQYFGSGSQIQAKVSFLTVGLVRKFMLGNWTLTKESFN